MVLSTEQALEIGAHPTDESSRGVQYSMLRQLFAADRLLVVAIVLAATNKIDW